MTAELVLPDEQSTAAEYAPIVHEAGGLLVENDDQYEQAGAFLQRIRIGIDQVHELVDPVCDQTNKAHKSATGLRSRLLAPLEEAKQVIADRMGSHVWEKEVAAREERLRIQKEQEAANRKAARELRKTGASDAAVQAARTEPAPPPATTATPPKVAGVSVLKRWVFVVDDVQKLLRAIADGKLDESMVTLNTGALNRWAASTRNTVTVPGGHCREETGVAS